MEFTTVKLVTAFLYSLAAGGVIALLYEPVRFFHMCGFKGRLCYFFCDTFFMIFCGLLTYFFSIVMLEGMVRFFVIFGETLGFCAFSCILRRLADKIYMPVIRLFKKILKNLLKLSRKVMYNTVYTFRKVFLKARNLTIIVVDRIGSNEKRQEKLKRRNSSRK